MPAGCYGPRPPRRALLHAVLCLVLIALLATCARPTPTPTPAPVTIRFACHGFDGSYFQALAKAFQTAHPNVEITIEAKGPQGLVGLAPGDADTMLVPDVRARQQKGYLMAVDPWLAADKAFAPGDYYPGTLQLYAREGKNWAIPFALDPLVIYYNKDLFDRYGVPYPQPGWTRDDFVQTALALRHAQDNVYGYAVFPAAYQGGWAIFQHGGVLFDDWQNPTRTTFDDPKTIEGVAWYAGLIYDLDVAPSLDRARELFGGSSDSAVYYGVSAGKVGMWAWTLDGRDWPLPITAPFKYGIAPLPRDAKAITWAPVYALAISSEARHPEVCWQWIAYLSRQLPSRSLPARKTLAESKEYEQRVGSEVAAVARASMTPDVLLSAEVWADPAFPRAVEAIYKAMTEVIAGRATAQQALTEAQQAMTR